MRRKLWVLVLVGALAGWICVAASAIGLAEIGLQVHITHDIYRSDDGLGLGVIVGGYCKVSMAEGWTMRAELSSPLLYFIPQLGIATTHALGDRLAVEAQLVIQTDFLETAYLTLLGGGRVLVAGTAESRVMASTFPLSLVGFYSSYGGLSVFPMLVLNGYLDISWWPSEHWTIGQAIGFTAQERIGDQEMLFPLGDALGLRFGATTHAGYRP